MRKYTCFRFSLKSSTTQSAMLERSFRIRFLIEGNCSAVQKMKQSDCSIFAGECFDMSHLQFNRENRLAFEP